MLSRQFAAPGAILVSAILAWLPAQAQGVRADPAESSASVPPLQYRSALADYQQFRDEPVGPWKELLNDLAGTGGHAGHVGAQPASPSASPRTQSGAPGAGADAGKSNSDARPKGDHASHH